MKRLIAIILSLLMLFCGCSSSNEQSSSSVDIVENNNAVSEENKFTGLDDKELLTYLKSNVYTDLVESLNSDKYFVENVDATYISKEYLDEVAYNSQANIYFGYNLSDLDKMFDGKKYNFTLGEEGQTTVKEVQEYDDTYEQIIKNVAIGTGVILLCVTVSIVTSGVAPAVSVILACSAKTGTVIALSSSSVTAISTGIVTAIETKDVKKTLKAMALDASEDFKWGAIFGVCGGGVSKLKNLKGLTTKGLTLNEAAKIQKKSKYAPNIIKNVSSVDEYNIYKSAGLKSEMIGGKDALTRDIDLDFVSEYGGKKMTNLERIKQGISPIDPKSGKAYELHHVGQDVDSPLAILTKQEHTQDGNYSILHDNKIAKGVHNEENLSAAQWEKQRTDFWKSYYDKVISK